ELAKEAKIVEAELAQSQMAVRAATTDGERQQRGVVVNMSGRRARHAQIVAK
ncbi:unnamed protein product, partial [Adineta steineri]